MSAAGQVSLVGAGPGDPELITVRGLRVLSEADVVVYDRLAPPELLAEARADAELVDVGKRAGKHAVPQEEINALLVRKARQGKRVARLKGGDPFLFGRGGEEIEALAAAAIPFEVIPGVTAASGASACCGIPLTVRGLSSSVTFVTGHEDPTKGESQVDWEALARTGGTLVVYMGVGRLEEIASALMAGGMPEDTPAAVVRRATTPEQKMVEAPLDRIAEAVREQGLTPPALVIVGEVARPERRAPWFELLPLFGRRIVVTRSRKQASVLVRRLWHLGAHVLEFPTIKVEPPEDAGPLDQALEALSSYDYVIFTSANAVESVWARFSEIGLDTRSFSGARIAAIGEATATALLDAGLRADILPERYTAEGLLEAMLPEDVSGKRVLLPRARDAREVLPEGLRSRGATVDVVEAYRTVRPAACGTARPHVGHGSTELAEVRRSRTQAARPHVGHRRSRTQAARRALDALVEGKAGEKVDLVTFTSSSTVRNLAELVGPDKLKAVLQVPAAAIGPVTAKTARELGFSIVVQPESYTIPALVEAIEEHFVTRSPKNGDATVRRHQWHD